MPGEHAARFREALSSFGFSAADRARGGNAAENAAVARFLQDPECIRR